MRSNANEVISDVIRREGGYVDHPDDRGGPTKYGITLRTLADWRGKPVTAQDVMALTEDEARKIYLDRYYLKPGFALVATVSPKIAAELTDTGVNMGADGADLPSVFLQRALNALNLKARIYPDVKVDGNVGPATVDALRKLLAYRGERGERVVLKALDCLQGARYLELAERREANESFVFGWLDQRVGL